MKVVTTEFQGVDVGLTDETMYELGLDDNGLIYIDGVPTKDYILFGHFGKYFILDELDYLKMQLENTDEPV